MKLYKLSLIIQITKSPQIPKLNYENLEKLKRYNKRFLTFGNWDALMMFFFFFEVVLTYGVHS